MKAILVVLVGTTVLLFGVVRLRFVAREPKGPKESKQETTNLPQTSIIRETTDTLIVYKLYGRIVSLDNTTDEGVLVSLVLSKDPLFTRIPVIILRDEGGYTVVSYDGTFDGTKTITTIEDVALRELIGTIPTVELRMPFLRSRVTNIDQALMRALDGINIGNWQHLPTYTVLRADTLGVIQKNGLIQ